MDRRLLASVFGLGGRLALEAELSDADLLVRLAAADDGREAAFAEVVRRHGPMVWTVCRRRLTDPADAEDAFQAVFLAFLQNQRTARWARTLPGWLYGVAERIVLKMNRSAVRQRQREGRVARPEAGEPVPDSAWDVAERILHDELARLPAVLRTAFLVCEINHVPQPEAARQLGWKLGTLSGRLCQARQRLEAALTARGLLPATVAGVLVTVPSSSLAVPWRLIETVYGFVQVPKLIVPAAIGGLAANVTSFSGPTWKVAVSLVMMSGGLGLSIGSAVLPNALADGAGTTPAVVAPLICSEMPKLSDKNTETELSVPQPDSLEAFKKLLTDRGLEGWEYIGTEPGLDGKPVVMFRKPVDDKSPEGAP